MARAILRDEQKYPDPDAFDPARFLLPDGQLNPEMPDPLEGFGYGRRICPGRYLAQDILFIAISNILAAFSIDSQSIHLFDFEKQAWTTWFTAREGHVGWNSWSHDSKALYFATDKTGNKGYYQITAVYSGYNVSDNNQVYVYNYYDKESNQSYTPVSGFGLA